jgi:hypothetical protein
MDAAPSWTDHGLMSMSARAGTLYETRPPQWGPLEPIARAIISRETLPDGRKRRLKITAVRP